MSYQFKVLFVFLSAMGPGLTAAEFVDLGPLTYSAPQSATVLCPPDLHFQCPQQKGVPTPLKEGVLAHPAYRVQSFGETRILLHLKSKAGKTVFPFLRVEGPLAESGDRTPIGKGQVVAESEYRRDSDGSYTRLDLTLSQPGVYRILTGTQASFEKNESDPKIDLELNSRCDENCFRPTVDARAFIKANGKAAAENGVLAGYIIGALQETFDKEHKDFNLSEYHLITAQFLAWLRGERDRFPVLPPLPTLTFLRPLISGLEADIAKRKKKLSPRNTVESVEGSLPEILAKTQAEREFPKPVLSGLPHITYGHFPLETLSRNQVQGSLALAKILNSLAEGNGEIQIRVGKRIRKIHTPWDLFDALIASGHEIEVRNERTYANFIALNDGQTPIQWPVWLDSGVPLSDGTNMIAPVGHSHHAWRIQGPFVDARVSFFLGINGVGFWANIDERPEWTGFRLSYSRTSSKDKNFILNTVKTATAYFKRIRAEARTIAKDKPGDGYGYLGLCNDSNATLELVTNKTITAYPIARAKELVEIAPKRNDGLDEALARLPKDADDLPVTESEKKDVLNRIWAMSAHFISSPSIPDKELERQLRLLKKDRQP